LLINIVPPDKKRRKKIKAKFFISDDFTRTSQNPPEISPHRKYLYFRDPCGFWGWLKRLLKI